MILCRRTLSIVAITVALLLPCSAVAAWQSPADDETTLTDPLAPATTATSADVLRRRSTCGRTSTSSSTAAWATRCAHGPGSRAPGWSRCWSAEQIFNRCFGWRGWCFGWSAEQIIHRCFNWSGWFGGWSAKQVIDYRRLDGYRRRYSRRSGLGLGGRCHWFDRFRFCGGRRLGFRCGRWLCRNHSVGAA